MDKRGLAFCLPTLVYAFGVAWPAHPFFGISGAGLIAVESTRWHATGGLLAAVLATLTAYLGYRWARDRSSAGVFGWAGAGLLAFIVAAAAWFVGCHQLGWPGYVLSGVVGTSVAVVALTKTRVARVA